MEGDSAAHPAKGLLSSQHHPHVTLHPQNFNTDTKPRAKTSRFLNSVCYVPKPSTRLELCHSRGFSPCSPEPLPPRSADRSWAASSRGSSPEGRRCFLPAGSDGNLLSESVCGGRRSLSQLSGVSMRFSQIYSCELLFLLKEEEEPIESFTPRSHFCCRTSAWPWGS